MAWFRKIKAGLVKDDINSFVGEEGNIFFDVSNGEFRLSDGVTPGGIVINTSGGGGSYTLPIATDISLGGVKIGSNINITNGVISVAAPFSKSYLDLTNTPTIPSALSQLSNDSGYITSSSLVWSNITSKPTFSVVATSGSYTDLLNTPNPEDEVAYAKRVDFISENLLYKGEAAPGTSPASPGWRISKITMSAIDDDVTTEWASGNANFDKIWNDHLVLSYV